MTPHESAKPCGCDPGAKWLCARHRVEANGLTPQTYGDCIACDNYILTESEAPYCPTCARLTREGTQP